jgi:peptide/nickel transport system permease protein
MLKYISRRLLQAIPTLLISSIFVFLIIRAIPGDPARTIVGLDAPIEEVEAVRVELGLDQPIPIQYIRWIRRALRGDLGKSAVNRFPVNEIIAMKFPATVELAVAAMLAALAVSVPLGIIAALKAGTRFDYFVSVLSALYQGAPNFWVGIMYILIFSVNLKLLPPSGRVPLLEAPARALQSLIMPVITLCMPMAMGQMRFVRASLVPVVTVLGIQFGHLLGGAVIVESLFGWPGLGRSLVESITNRDYAITQGGLLYMVTVFVLVNLAVDVLYGIIDPRSRPRQER